MGRKPKVIDKALVKRAIPAALKYGITDADLSKTFGISVDTFKKFLKNNPDILVAIKEDKEKCTDKVELALYTQAIGYEHYETKSSYNSVLDKWVDHQVLVYHPPNIAACIFWLKNKRPDQWRDLQQINSKTELTEKTTVHIIHEDREGRPAEQAGGSFMMGNSRVSVE